jgi:putative transposase
MKRNRAFRYELKPNVNQKILLAKHAGASRFAYNWGLAQRIEMYEKDKKSTNAIEQHKLLNSLKATQFPWMYEVSKCAMQEALRDLDKAYTETHSKFGFWTAPKPRDLNIISCLIFLILGSL